MPRSYRSATSAEANPSRPAHAISAVIAPFLMKLAKHMALLSCLIIVGRATGRVSAGELTIFLLVLAAAVFHAVGRRLTPSPPVSVRYDRRAP